MSAPPRVNIETIKEALRKTGGNIAASADIVGMRRGSLIGRLEVAGIDANTYRPPLAARRSVPTRAPISIRSESLERLRQAAFDLAYLRRKEHTAVEVLEEFLAEAFEPWLKGKASGRAT